MAEKIEEKGNEIEPKKNTRVKKESTESKINDQTATKKRTTKKVEDASNNDTKTTTRKRTTKKVEDALNENTKPTGRKRTTKKVEDTLNEDTKPTTRKRTTKKVEDASNEDTKPTARKRTTKKVEDALNEDTKPTARKRTTKKTEDELKEDKNRRGDYQSPENQEKIKNKNEKLPVVEKKGKNTLTKKEQKELETIEKEIKLKQAKSQEKMSTIYGNVFKNILYAIIVILYFILIIMGYNLIKQVVFVTLLKVLSMTLIITTICVFEKAYKKDSGKLAITGIEFLVLSICTLLSIRIYTIFNSKFVSSITSFALLFAIYYVAKAIKVYIQEKKQLKKEVNDIVTRRE